MKKKIEGTISIYGTLSAMCCIISKFVYGKVYKTRTLSP
jgi:hypothetical protein